MSPGHVKRFASPLYAICFKGVGLPKLVIAQKYNSFTAASRFFGIF